LSFLLGEAQVGCTKFSDPASRAPKWDQFNRPLNNNKFSDFQVNKITINYNCGAEGQLIYWGYLNTNVQVSDADPALMLDPWFVEQFHIV